MKRLARIGLRILGIVLVLFVLSRIQIRDHLVWPSGAVEEGALIEKTETTAVFRVASNDQTQVVSLTDDAAPTIKKGVLSIVKEANQDLLWIALLVFGPLTLISITRWWMLLRAIRLPLSFMQAIRLSYIGFFFNAVVPGLTGGDVVKAFYVSRGSHEPYKTFLSVFVDRAIGLFGLTLLASVVVTLHLGQPEFRDISFFVYGAVFVASAAGAVIFSRRLRRLFRVEAVLSRLPFGGVLTKIDQAVTIYREAPRAVLIAVLMSVANHAGLVGMTVLIGRALGITNPISHFFAIAPVCFIIASIPVVPGGWGMREGAFAYFFATVGVSPESSVSTSLLLGLAQLCWYMLGGPVFIADPDRASKEKIAAFDADLANESATSADSPAPPAG